MLRFFSCISVSIILLAGCKSSGGGGGANADLSSSSRDLIVPQNEVGIAFDFCAEKKSFSLTNAMWLSYLAANQYAHFKELGPLLEKLGFGDKGEGAAFVRYWYELRIKRIQEKLIDKDDTWTTEEERLIRLEAVKTEYARIVGSPYVEDKTSAAALEQKLVTAQNPNAKIQFVSGFEAAKTGEKAKASTQAFYAEHPAKNFAVISFRGTETDEKPDMAVNDQKDHTPMAGFGLAHTGFQKGLKQVEDKLIKILQARSSTKPLNLWITGHSLGAALGTLMTARVMQLKEAGQLPNVRLIGTYHIGSPRVGDAEFAEKFDALAQKQQVNMVRIRNYHDLVTVIPFGLPFKPGYWHVGALAYFDANGKIFYGDGWEKIENESDLKTSGLPTSIADHAGEKYFSLAKKAYQDNLNTPLTDCAMRAEDRPLLPYKENPASR